MPMQRILPEFVGTKINLNLCSRQCTMYNHCKKDSTLRKPDISGCLVVLFSIVLDLVSQVRDVVLMNVYMDLGNSGGSGFWNGGYMSQGREMGS